jgi:putative ABC transport system permease protein
VDAWTLLFFAAALLAAAAVLAESLRRPILRRMALRNAWRRPKQTATVIAGLMVGTAIISSALVAGDSAAGAIRGYVYQSLGAVDESVAIPGYPYFPQAVYDKFLADPGIQRSFDGVAAHVVWQGALEDQRTGAFEPNVAVVGYDTERDAGFGDYHLLGGGGTDGRALVEGQAIATKHLAEQLGLQAGDAVRLSFVKPIDPLLPRIVFTNGTLTGADPSLLVPGAPGVPPVPVPAVPGAPPLEQLHTIPVEKSATRLTVVLAWDAALAPVLPPTIVLAAHLTAPDGATYDAVGRPSGADPVPLLLNVTTAPDRTLPVGNWTLQVSASAGANLRYVGAGIVLYPVYDLALLQERAQALQGEVARFKDRLGGLSDFAARETADLQVVQVTDGGRGDLFDFRDALFIRIGQAQQLFGREGQVNLVKFSNPGPVHGGETGTDAAMPLLNATLTRVKGEYPDIASVQNLEATPTKQEFLEVADSKGQTLTGLLVFAGSLSIITGLLLILNIFTMLAEERRSELGMSRAVGMTRGDLVRLFLFEGSLYAVVAALLGALLGLALAYLMIGVMNTIIAHLATDLSFPPIEYSPSLAAVLLAFSAGSLLTFGTILAASRRASRLNVVRAIRRIEEPEARGNLRAALLAAVPLAGIGLALTILGVLPRRFLFDLAADYRFTLVVVGPLLVTLGLGVALRPVLPRRRLYPWLAALLALYYAVTYFTITSYDNRQEANVLGPVRGVLLTLCAVVLVVHFERGIRLLGRLLARIPRLRPLAIPAVSYPLHRKFRTGMTLAMFSVVLLSIGFFSIFGALFQTDPTRQTGGFDIEARTTLTVPDLGPYDQGTLPSGLIAARLELPEFRTEDRNFLTVSGEQTGTFRDYRHVVYGYDAEFARAQKFRLLERIPEYATDEAAYEGVLSHPGQVIVSYLYSTNAEGQALVHKAGETLQMHFGNETLEFTIAGIQEQYHFPGVFLPKERVDGLFPATARVYLFKVGPGVDPVEAARQLERNYRQVGMDAKPSLAEVLEEQASFRQVLGAMKLFLGLGLLVGVLSLGIITSRSVLERRQEIGMLRALGYTGGQVRGIFFIEVTFTILLGALVGIACAILVTYGLWFAIIRQLNYPYVVPWGEIGVLVLVSYLVAMLATAAPIGRSAKVAPAEALRYLE